MNAEDLIGMGSGITLRMYLIAHAPEEPQGWFQPSGIESAPPPPRFPADLWTDDERNELDGYNEGALEATLPRVVSYVRAREAHSEALFRIGKEREMQRYIQWPGAWADRQIELENARNKT